MSKTIEHEDFLEISDALRAWDPYLMSHKRIEIFDNAGDELNKIKSNIDFDGAAYVVAINTLSFLDSYGKLESGELAIVKYLQCVVKQIKDPMYKKIKSKLEEKIKKYS